MNGGVALRLYTVASHWDLPRRPIVGDCLTEFQQISDNMRPCWQSHAGGSRHRARRDLTL